MTRTSLTLLISVALVAISACESKPAVDPDAPKSPEWESCIAAIQAYGECKIDEAGQIDSGIQGRVKSQMKVMRNKSLHSEENCSKVLNGLPSDDCAPE